MALIRAILEMHHIRACKSFRSCEEDQEHPCNAGVDCPLARAVEGLHERVDRIVKNIRGVPLDLQGNHL